MRPKIHYSTAKAIKKELAEQLDGIGRWKQRKHVSHYCDVKFEVTDTLWWFIKEMINEHQAGSKDHSLHVDEGHRETVA